MPRILDMFRQVRILLVAALSILTFPLSGSTVASQPAADQGPELILIVNVDTLRRDRLGVYGNRRNLTPNIDRIARESGVVFDAAYAAANHTRPSVASLFSGVYPTRHNFWNPFTVANPLRPNIATILPKPFSKILANANPNTVHLYSADFDSAWSEYPESNNRDASQYRDSAYYPAEVVFRRALELVERAGWPDQLFLYVQPADPHDPYYPLRRYPDLFRDDALADSISGKYGSRLSTLRWDENLMARPQAEIQNLINRYDAEVRYLDEELGHFLSLMLARYPTHTVIFSSDHGESFRDHNDAAHTTSLFDEQIRVPLFIVDSRKRFGRSRRVPDLVSQVDVLPTLALLVGTPVPASIDGLAIQTTLERSDAFWPLTKRRTVVSEVVHSSAVVDFTALQPESQRVKLLYFKDHPINVLVRATIEYAQGPFGTGSLVKYIRNDARSGTEALQRFPGYFFHPHFSEMYDLVADPLERQSHVRLAAAQRIIASSPLRDTFPVITRSGVELTKEQLDRLRALGYIK